MHICRQGWREKTTGRISAPAFISGIQCFLYSGTTTIVLEKISGRLTSLSLFPSKVDPFYLDQKGPEICLINVLDWLISLHTSIPRTGSILHLNTAEGAVHTFPSESLQFPTLKDVLQ